jgi:hypothetical protein
MAPGQAGRRPVGVAGVTDGIVLGAYGPGDPRILGSTPFTCDLCMATGWSAIPCPFHDDKAWADWLAEAFREWAYAVMRDLRR